uniref:Uncharacterized protein n=1 Tax=Chromera velia CCMP2878 TaxID=1169474 RepID=A0A0G4I1B3_9ALVE|eukprot:Cvel_10107.t1-p1 / transcript=Cvel_10107.t1 / gene=Cvel_10107 / organism=Chromera_velia_CCMP2878 / gene_product=hypothetical protein / transcript_product=hypothetical protein / location=Cvel_scaffold602:21915-22870(+) / protein_length=259 / sequence_SO=supercontig / SO=protein_coding / is_pseudo=false
MGGLGLCSKEKFLLASLCFFAFMTLSHSSVSNVPEGHERGDSHRMLRGGEDIQEVALLRRGVRAGRGGRGGGGGRGVYIAPRPSGGGGGGAGAIAGGVIGGLLFVVLCCCRGVICKALCSRGESIESPSPQDQYWSKEAVQAREEQRRRQAYEAQQRNQHQHQYQYRWPGPTFNRQPQPPTEPFYTSSNTTPTHPQSGAPTAPPAREDREPGEEPPPSAPPSSTRAVIPLPPSANATVAMNIPIPLPPSDAAAEAMNAP